ncbi:hypothetical protein [Brevibacterium aurantiacum]|uniref:Uncharacterized protein n=1 Tax=Brevibacterium aurantiacum TaxID=273384 RepID=A0A556CQG0_BREAU|nr:hypothetical protein [Brevibacterium aurantiacum]TSI19660.1 hypothetical protein FO013_01555 [Brevibacterium aurantiacum]
MRQFNDVSLHFGDCLLQNVIVHGTSAFGALAEVALTVRSKLSQVIFRVFRRYLQAGCLRDGLKFYE